MVRHDTAYGPVYYDPDYVGHWRGPAWKTYHRERTGVYSTVYRTKHDAIRDLKLSVELGLPPGLEAPTQEA